MSTSLSRTHLEEAIRNMVNALVAESKPKKNAYTIMAVLGPAYVAPSANIYPNEFDTLEAAYVGLEKASALNIPTYGVPAITYFVLQHEVDA